MNRADERILLATDDSTDEGAAARATTDSRATRRYSDIGEKEETMRQQATERLARWWPIAGLVCLVGAFAFEAVEAVLAGVALVALVAGALLTTPRQYGVGRRTSSSAPSAAASSVG
jgi:hypothetical protein